MPKNEWKKYRVTATKMICIDYEVVVEAANESHAKSCAEVGELSWRKNKHREEYKFHKIEEIPND